VIATDIALTMRIVFVIPGFSINADDWAIPSMQILATALAQEHDIHVFSLRYPAAGNYLFENLTHHAMGGGSRGGIVSLKIIWQTVSAIFQLHRRNPIDILHGLWADESGFVAAIAAARLGRSLIVSLLGGELVYIPEVRYGTQGSFFRRWMIRMALGKADLVTTGSSFLYEIAHKQGVPEEKLRLLTIGADISRFYPGSRINWDNPAVLQAASLNKVKNQRLLLEVARSTRITMPDLRYLVAGDGSQKKELMALVREYGLDGSITWLGQIPYSDMPAVYQQGHLYLQTSLHESQSLSVLEALASGLPALGTPVGILNDVACLPPSWSADELAGQIIQMLDDKREYRKSRTEARNLVESRYSLANTLGQLQSLYAEIN
jgi:glycosyltransferase involved in cell wall biosynthesis